MSSAAQSGTQRDDSPFDEYMKGDLFDLCDDYLGFTNCNPEETGDLFDLCDDYMGSTNCNPAENDVEESTAVKECEAMLLYCTSTAKALQSEGTPKSHNISPWTDYKWVAPLVRDGFVKCGVDDSVFTIRVREDLLSLCCPYICDGDRGQT